MLPNLIVIGALKSGTTSLHRYLAKHSQIAMSEPKELRFFIEERNWTKGLAWYESHFTEPAPVRGESSPDYTAYPGWAGVPERMAGVVPDAKLIYLVRDPLERIVSEYRFRHWIERVEMRPFSEVVADPDASQFVANSRYAMQLDRYLQHFPAERILVVDSADLAERRGDTLRGVFRFLGVDERFTSAAFADVHNETDALHRNALGMAAVDVLNRVLGRSRASALRHRAPQPVLRLIRTSRAPIVELAPSLRSSLVDYLKADTDRFRALTGMDFVHWSV